MTRRAGFTLIEVVVATTLLLFVVLGVGRATSGLFATAGRATRWRRTAQEVAQLHRRFTLAPCTLGGGGSALLVAGELRLQWSVDGDSGRLHAVAWPGDAPSVVRRGLIRSVLPCD